jgi:hypothetical protein
MNLGLVSIQRDRNPWIVEWLAFHLLVGFDRFFIYAHKTRDGMTDTLLKLARHYPIVVHAIEMDAQPQLAAYRHAWQSYGHQLDWLAFLDGDEFLLPMAHETVPQALAAWNDKPVSALAAYWCCYGGNALVVERQGLVMQNFARHRLPDFLPNRHVKSIVRGGEAVDITGSHVFHTPQGTVDELGRPITGGFMRELEPSWQTLRINHYAVQSWQFFKRTKQHMGAADADPALVRPDGWYHQYDRNEIDDGTSHQWLLRLKLKVAELERALTA